jgi:cytochrome c-type biogenesis protein CcmI
MLFWFIATVITAIACAALFYAAGRRAVNLSDPDLDDANSHFRLVLAGIDTDLAAGKLGEAEAQAARGELAREILRLKAEAGRVAGNSLDFGRPALLASISMPPSPASRPSSPPIPMICAAGPSSPPPISNCAAMPMPRGPIAASSS